MVGLAPEIKTVGVVLRGHPRLKLRAGAAVEGRPYKELPKFSAPAKPLVRVAGNQRP